MNEFIKKNINTIVGGFILLQPILDLLTGLCLHVLNIDFTLGIILKVFFACLLMYISVFTYKKKKMLIPYLILLVYLICYILSNGTNNLFLEIQNLFKTFYFPVVLISLFSIKDELRISKYLLFTTLYTYLICIFVPTIFGIGYKTYEVTKAGTLGFYNSANEISGIISLLTPIMFLIFKDEKNIIKKIILIFIYLSVILMVGTKTPLIALFITLFFTVIYAWRLCFKNKNYKPITYSAIGLLITLFGLTLIIPKTNFYKNIETHLDFLGVNNVVEIFKDKELIDHFIFSQRLTFLKDKAFIYAESPMIQQIFGIGYINNSKETKLIEMDYFDIFFSHGVVGFIIFFSIVIPVVIDALKSKRKLDYERYMLLVSFLLIIFLSFFTGHIITGPSVSLISAILIIMLLQKNKKELLFTSVFMDLGGIEKALLTLVNRIDSSKYNVTLCLEEKRGIFLDQIKDEVKVKEVKVNNNSNIVIRKLINFKNKFIYKVFNYKTFDFSCCYATYSYSSSKLALMSSDNTAFYVHNDYRTIYKDINEFKYFFNSRNIKDYKKIIFVSNENKEGFIEVFKELEKKTKVYNNFIDTKEIINKSNEILDTKKGKNKLLVYVGRLDDNAKKISRQINLVKNIENIDLWIIGDGPDKNKYIKEVKELNLENRITFFGKQSNPFKYMSKADYIILTSDYEGFPVTYLEAITLSKSIITTFPTSDDVVDIKEYGHVISKDEDKMVKEVKAILKKKDIVKEVDLEKGQTKRMKKLEELFDGVK